MASPDIFMSNDKGIQVNSRVDFFVILALSCLIFFLNLPFVRLEFLSPDASLYLNAGRNLFSGKGALISYNIYQFWPGKYHPSLPYIPPVFPIIAGLIWFLFGLEAVIGFNVMLLAVNCALLYKIIKLDTDSFTAFLISLFMGFSSNLVLSAIYPWTEQLHLLFFLVAAWVYLKYPQRRFLLGVILGANCLVRFAAIFDIFAFSVALMISRGFSKKTLREAKEILFGFLSIFLTYEVFCYFRYGALYPQYLATVDALKISWIVPGAFYKDGLPVLNVLAPKLSKEVITANLRYCLINFMRTFGVMKFVFILVPLYIAFNVLKQRSAFLILFLSEGFIVISGHVLKSMFLPIPYNLSTLDIVRYTIIPFITLGCIGLLAVRRILASAFSKELRVWAFRFFLITFFVLFYFQLKQYLYFRNYYINIFPIKHNAYKESRKIIYTWIRNNTAESELVASSPSFAYNGFLLHRPFVSLPAGEVSNEKNWRDFLFIYAPRYIILHDQDVKLVDFLQGIGYTKKIETGFLVLLEFQM